MSTLSIEIETAKVFRPLLDPHRYKGAHGGRGSGKSHFFADLLVEEHLSNPGFRSICGREVQRSIRESSKRLIEDKIEEFGLGAYFNILETEIRTPGDGVITFQGLQSHTSESIKSYEGYNRVWVEEAQTVSERSLTMLRPTIRAPGSELWFSWNPRHKRDAVDALLRGDAVPTDAVVVQANWAHNPWFPAELEQERLDDKINRPEQYDHIWEGAYETIYEGAYYASHLARAMREGRIGNVQYDPLMSVRTYHDLGGTSMKADAYSIVTCQFIGKEMRVLDGYETIGQEPADHIQYLRDWAEERGIKKMYINLPHDGSHTQINQSWENIWRRASDEKVKFVVTVSPPLGGGAPMKRVNAARLHFPKIWFNESTTGHLREMLARYHERKHPETGIGLGPMHDDASHSADAFGQMCIDYSEVKADKPKVDDYSFGRKKKASSGWAW